MMQLIELLYLNKPGVYALINEQDKRVYIGWSRNMLRSVTQLISDLNAKKWLKPLRDDMEFLSVIILETFPKPSTKDQRIAVGKYTDLYVERGYTLYRDYRGLRYKIRTYIGTDFNIHVEARSQSNVTIKLGVFPSVPEADAFILKHYGVEQKVNKVVYSYNKLTKQWYNNEPYGALVES